MLHSRVGGAPVAVEAELPTESILQADAGLKGEVVLKDDVMLKGAGCSIEQVAELNTPDARALLDIFV